MRQSGASALISMDLRLFTQLLSLFCLASPVHLLAYHLMHVSSTKASKLPSSSMSASLFVFGASMVDSGTTSFAMPLSRVADYDPYGSDYFGEPVGRWSNGRTFMDILTQSLGFGFLDPFLKSVGANFTHGVNFACAGSTAQNVSEFLPLLVQVDQFRKYQSLVRSQQQGSRTESETKQLYSDSIYFIETAHNDYRTAGVDSDHQELVELVIASMRRAFERLYELGARTMIVMNVTPLGCSPAMLSSAESTSTRDDDNCVAAWNELVILHNHYLDVLLDDLRSKYPSAEWILFDAYNIFLDGYRNPSNYGIKYPFQACCGAGGPYNFVDEVHCGESAKYINGTYTEWTKCEDEGLHLIWDSIHPTESFCKHIANGILYGSHLIPSFNITERVQYVRSNNEDGYIESMR